MAQKVNELYQVLFIFLTANSDAETIDPAKKVKPHAYIVKPFTKEELFAAIEIAFINFTGNRSDTKPEPSTSYPAKDFIFVKTAMYSGKSFLMNYYFLKVMPTILPLILKAKRKYWYVLHSMILLSSLIQNFHPDTSQLLCKY